MLDKYTFGKTPAAIYLAARLNEIDNVKFTRKISAQIIHAREIITQTCKAHSEGIVSTKVLGFICEKVRVDIQNTADDMLHSAADYRSDFPLPDTLAVNLMTNIVCGDIKSVKRKAARVKLLEKEQQRMLTKDKFKSPVRIEGPGGVILGDVEVKARKIKLDSIKDKITPETLIKKSKVRIKRINAPDTLY